MDGARGTVGALRLTRGRWKDARAVHEPTAWTALEPGTSANGPDSLYDRAAPATDSPALVGGVNEPSQREADQL